MYKYALIGLCGASIIACGVLVLDPFTWRASEHTIILTENGYQPATLTIARGDAVRFENATSKHHWPASDLHPTHTIYPDFDSRQPLAPDESWTFRFRQAGEWAFHDHLRANLVGTITVTQ